MSPRPDLSTRLTQLGEVLVSLASSPIPSHQFQILADFAPHLLPCDYLALCLMDPDEQAYHVHSLYGAEEVGPLRDRYPLEYGLVGEVMATGRIQSLPAFNTTITSAPGLDGVWHAAGLRRILVAPLRQGKRRIGALVVAARPGTLPGEQYDTGDQQIARLLMAGLASTLETARLYQISADERSTLAAVLSSTRDAIIVVNQQGRILLANPAVQEMLHLDPDSLVSRPLAQAVAHPTLQRLFAEGARSVADIALDEGRTAQASLVPVRTDYGEQIGWAAILRDITLLKELEQVKSDFVNTVSHDLKNPISTILLGAELLVQSGPLNKNQRFIQERLINTAGYMEELVTDLLDLGKIEMGLEMEMKPVDAAAMMDAVVGLFRPDAEAAQLSLVFQAPEPAVVVGDQIRLQQAYRNLVGNAIKYTPAGGQVNIQVQVRRRQLPAGEGKPGTGAIYIHIADTGYGIPAEAQPYIFDKFYRVETGATRDIRGTGLGLAITKSIIEAHGGRIWVESSAGSGSTFSISLPAAGELSNS